MSIVTTTGTSIGTGICYDHDPPLEIELFPITAVTPRAICQGSFINGYFDVYVASCGHYGIIVSGSVASILNGRFKAGVGSVIIGLDADLIGVVVTGVPNNIIGR